MRGLIEMGIHGIETDDPLLLARVLSETPLPRRLERDHPR
jgi:hypothetical protein